MHILHICITYTYIIYMHTFIKYMQDLSEEKCNFTEVYKKDLTIYLNNVYITCKYTYFE